MGQPRQGASGIPVVELLGAPATGKSTLAAWFAAQHGVEVVKDHSFADLPLLMRSVLSTWPTAVRTRPSAAPQTAGAPRWLAWAGRAHAAPWIVARRARHGSQAVVLDQGPVYTLGRLACMRASPAGTRWWDARMRACGQLLSALVVLDAEPRVLAARLRGRSKPHVADTLDDMALVEYLAAERDRADRLAGDFAAAGGRVVRIDTGSTDQATQVAMIVGVLGVPIPSNRRYAG